MIYGVKCVSAQTETAMLEIADKVEEEYPTEFLRKWRYVDDFNKSDLSIDKLETLNKDADIVFQKIGLLCKAWTYSGREPPTGVTMDNVVKLAGQRWSPKLDTVEVPVPSLHFSKKQHGKLPDNTDIFSGEFKDLQNFVPRKLSRR